MELSLPGSNRCPYDGVNVRSANLNSVEDVELSAQTKVISDFRKQMQNLFLVARCQRLRAK